MERFTVWICDDCGDPAHGPGNRCPADRRRTWTPMHAIETVPTQALLALVEEWEARADHIDRWHDSPAADAESIGFAGTREQAAVIRVHVRQVRQLLDPPE